MNRAGPRLLIVAANRQVREVLHQIFLGEGYTSQVASDGDEGLAAFRSHRASIVLTELAMPSMSGIEVLREVRSIDADVAVIVLADVFDVRTRTECLQLGADAYIVKPLNVGELLTAVERALEARDLIPPRPAPPPRQRSAGAGTDEVSPEQFLDVFEHRSREPKSRLDPQFTVGIPIIRLWMDLRSRETVFQTDLDGLLDRFAAAAVAGVEGTPLFDLWVHVVRWGQRLGLSVPDQHPWYRR